MIKWGFITREGKIEEVKDWKTVGGVWEQDPRVSYKEGGRAVAKDQVVVSRMDGDTQMMEVCNVSTVFLPLDHGFMGGPPLWFETMVFGGPQDQYQDRYSTLEEAVEGHNRVVAALRAGVQIDDQTTES